MISCKFKEDWFVEWSKKDHVFKRPNIDGYGLGLERRSQEGVGPYLSWNICDYGGHNRDRGLEGCSFESGGGSDNDVDGRRFVSYGRHGLDWWLSLDDGNYGGHDWFNEPYWSKEMKCDNLRDGDYDRLTHGHVLTRQGQDGYDDNKGVNRRSLVSGKLDIEKVYKSSLRGSVKTHKTPMEVSQATLKGNVAVETNDGLDESSYVKVIPCNQDGLTLRGSVKMTHHSQEEFEKWSNGDHGQARRPRRLKRIIGHKGGGRANMNDQMDSQGQMEVVGQDSMVVRSLEQQAVGWLEFLGQTCPRNVYPAVEVLGQTKAVRIGTLGWTADGLLGQTKIGPLEDQTIREFSPRYHKENDHMGSNANLSKYGPHEKLVKGKGYGPLVQREKWRGQLGKRGRCSLKRTYQEGEGPHQVTCGPNHKRGKHQSHMESHVFVYTNSAKCQRLSKAESDSSKHHKVTCWLIPKRKKEPKTRRVKCGWFRHFRQSE